jgi:uncharacterized protein YcbX
MAAESLDQVDVSWNGLVGDRRWAFIRAGMARNNFPWLTIRERPQMRAYRPSFVEPDRPDASRTMVRTPSGADLEVVDPALAKELGRGVRVIKQGRGIFDALPLSLITTQSVNAVGGLVGTELDVQRFRPNLLVDATDDEPFAEDEWIGSVLRIGDMRMRVDKRDQRCVMVNVDPGGTERAPAILRAIARERQTCLGVYGSTVSPGRVAVGDTVVIEPSS